MLKYMLSEKDIAAIEYALNKSGRSSKVEVKIENNKIVVLQINVKKVS